MDKLKGLLDKVSSLLSGNKIVVLGIKYIPIICTILLTLHIGALLVGLHEPVTVAFAAVLMVVLLVLLSIRFSFCRLHKALIIFMATVTLCICIQKYQAFGAVITAARLMMFAIGIGLVVLAICKIVKKDDCDGQ